MHYLDDLCLYPNPTAESTRKEVKGKVQDWIAHSDLEGSLEDAFRLWDAVSGSIDVLFCHDTYSVPGLQRGQNSRRQGQGHKDVG